MSLNEKPIPKPKFGKGENGYRKSWHLSLLIFIYFAVLLLNGLDEFIRSGFNINFIGTGEWWYKVFRVLFSNILVFIGTFMYLLGRLLNLRREYIKRKQRLENIVDSELDPVTFDPFYIDFERDRKITYYKKELRKRINKLDDKAKLENIKLWTSQQKNVDEEGNIIDSKLYDDWLSCKYCQKKQILYEQLEKKFIEENIDFIVVPYKPNSKSFVTDGYNNPSTRYDEYAVESKTHKLIWDLLPKFAIMAGFLIAGESIIVEFAMTDSMSVALFNMLKKVLPMFIQIYYAFIYSEAYMDEKIMVDLRKRENIVTKYLSVIGQKGVEKYEL